ncbi:gala protein [Dactylosporangium sp. NPDC050688]|uniref:gala protein n=1 Tax=Dactylosporangium sp. NPDC050688 TaxID=3157217 RepID=UPI0033D894CE
MVDDNLDSPGIACPVLAVPAVAQADLADLAPLLRRLTDPEPVRGTERFPLGTLQPDGRVDLCKQGLGPAGVTQVLDRVVGSPHAVHLLLGTNGLGATGTAALASGLPHGHRVETLYLGCNAIDAAGAAPLFERLTADDRVRALWLKRNPLGDEGVAALAATLRRNTTIDTVDLVNTGLTAAGLETLVDALAARPAPVTRVFLGGNGLGPSAGPLLARLVREAGVRGLFLAANRLGDDGVAPVVDALHAPGSTLGLGGNGLSPATVAAVAGQLHLLDSLDLSRPQSLRVLGAADNVVGDDGAALLAAALPGTRLRRLDLRHTGVGGRGAKALLAALPSTDLTRLALGPDVPRRVKRAISALLPPADAGPGSEIVSVYR